MKFGESFARTTPLPSRWSANCVTMSMTALLRLGGRNDFEQAQVARRVEEMRAEPMAAEVVAATLRQSRDRNAGRVRAHDRSGAPCGVHLLEQRPLDVQPLDDRLDDPVSLGDAGETSVKASGGDQLPGVGREERIRLERACALQPLRCRLGRHVKEQRRNAGVGEMGGDLRPHDASAEHGDGTNHSLSLPVVGPGVGSVQADFAVGPNLTVGGRCKRTVEGNPKRPAPDQVPEGDRHKKVDRPAVLLHPRTASREPQVLPRLEADEQQRHDFERAEDRAEREHEGGRATEVQVVQCPDDAASQEDGG